MNIKLGRVAAAFVLLLAVAGSFHAQDKQTPMTKEEILRLLKPTPGQRYEQGDLAAEVAQRGVAFKVDESTLAEFRKAGARTFLLDAIDQAAHPKPAPPPPPVPARTELPTENAAEPAKEAAPPVDLSKLPLLEQARHHALEYMEDLPNFLVTQFVERSVRTPEKKDWQLEDKLEVELAYRVKKGEQFKLVKRNGQPTTMSYADLRGATSTGEFGSMLIALFAEQTQADFKEVKRDTIRNRQTVVYEFRVKKAFSNNTLTDKTSGRSVTTAYSGSVWIELESGRVLRIEQSAEDIQRGFPITMAESAVEYDWVKINDERFLLPVYAEVILGNDAERTYSRNVIQMRNYHMFETDLKITN
ncbi:MAG: hypothetical protein HYR56_08430 [Acidobacteria bacterium]|nr:hypothetical protein [Acidobacteriota bacterium]MBI3425553.1 hypothetical protein [Acidobacteriota bacterium]